MTIKKFEADIQNFIKGVTEQQETELRKLALLIFTSVIKKSPVDTGRFRASWRVNLHAPDTSFEEDKDSNYGAPTFPGLNLTGFPLIFITNSLPYAEVIEDGGYPNPGKPHRRRIKGKIREEVRTTPQGFSTQAPKGVVKVTISEISTLLGL